MRGPHHMSGTKLSQDVPRALLLLFAAFPHLQLVTWQPWKGTPGRSCHVMYAQHTSSWMQHTGYHTAAHVLAGSSGNSCGPAKLPYLGDLQVMDGPWATLACCATPCLAACLVENTGLLLFLYVLPISSSLLNAFKIKMLRTA